MRKMRSPARRLTIALLCLLLLFNTGAAATSPAPNTTAPIKEDHLRLDPASHLGYVDNLLVLILHEGVDEQTALSWFPGEDAKVVGRFPRLRQIQVQVKPRTQQELETLAVALMQKPQVRFAHLELAASQGTQSRNSDQALQEEPPEPEEWDPYDPPSQQRPDNEWWHQAIGLSETLLRFPVKEYVKAGVVDDGFDTSHPDLRLSFPTKEALLQNYAEQHGTHVAGILSQVLPGATITVTDSYRIPEMEPLGHLGTQSQHLKHLVDLVEHGVRVINYSMGTDLTDPALVSWNLTSSGIYSVYLHLLLEAGHDFVIVQSAGNSGVDASLNTMFCSINPDNILGGKAASASLLNSKDSEAAKQAILDRIVVVASCDEKDATGRYPLLNDSNFGNHITVAAPGNNILSTVPGGYRKIGGTSQAAPIAAGVLTYAWSLNPALTGKEVKDILVNSATSGGAYQKDNAALDSRQDYPLVNLLAAAQLSMDTRAK